MLQVSRNLNPRSVRTSGAGDGAPALVFVLCQLRFLLVSKARADASSLLISSTRATASPRGGAVLL